MSIVRTLSWVLLGSLACGAVACSGSVVGGGTTDGGTTVDSGSTTDVGTPVDTGSPVDSGAPIDTGSVIDTSLPVDTGSLVDGGAPTDVGSIFDVSLPDISLGDGATVAGCYSCLETKCTSQLAACNSDPKCAALFSCVVETCAGGSAGTACLTGCYTSSGASSDPGILTTGENLLKCDQANCATDCPAGTAPLGDAATGG